MKRLLIYNQLPGSELEYLKTGQIDMQIEQVTSISGVLSRPLFKRRIGGSGEQYDFFLVNIYEPTKEIVEFLRYVHKNKPELPLIVMSRSTTKMQLEGLLKGVVNHILESCQMEDILEQILSPVFR